MPENKQCALIAMFILLGVAILAACQSRADTVTVEVTRVVVETVVKTVDVAVAVEVEVEPVQPDTPQIALPKDLIICTPHEPATLYPYGNHTLAEDAILHALFENDFTTLSFGYQPQGIEKIPSLADGDAIINAVEVSAGDPVVDAQGDVAILEAGVTVVTAEGTLSQFDGTPLLMDQMVVDFVMKQRFWSDGVPVTAGDSVYSFNLDSDPDTPTSKFENIRTASYETTGDLSVRWTGIPGFLHSTYFTNFWRPLPLHAWTDLSVAELLAAERSNPMSIGDGPFKIVEWVPRISIRLEPNEHYYRAEEGLPHLDSITFKFYPNVDQLMNQLLAGKCDIVTQDGLDMDLAPLLIEAEAAGLLDPYFQAGTIFEHIDFGINSWGNYGDGDGRPDWFEDVQVRQAMVMCTDRRRMIEEVHYGRSEIIHSYIPRDHPLYPDDLIEWPYDVNAANQLLDEMGLFDTDGDRIREEPISGEEFRVTFNTTTSYGMNSKVAQIFRQNMLDCGIGIEIFFLPANEWYANGSDSPLFGRRFDLGQLPWPMGVEPLCFLYASWEITGPGGQKNPDSGESYGGWSAANDTGWWDPEFDAACRAAVKALPGTPEYEENHKKALRIFSEEVPVIPLFPRLKVSGASPDVLNFKLDPTQRSELWNLFEIDLQR